MKKLALASALALGAGLIAGPAAASVIVLGSSPGHPCYQAAKAQSGSLSALRLCDEALASKLMSRRDTVATHVNRGIVRLWAGNHRGAVNDFDQAIALDPMEPESYLNKGSAFLRMNGDVNAAIALFNEALERNTRRPELAYFGRAIAHEVSGNARAAYNDYRRAQELAPEWENPSRELTRFRVIRAGGSF